MPKNRSLIDELDNGTLPRTAITTFAGDTYGYKIGLQAMQAARTFALMEDMWSNLPEKQLLDWFLNSQFTFEELTAFSSVHPKIQAFFDRYPEIHESAIKTYLGDAIMSQYEAIKNKNTPMTPQRFYAIRRKILYEGINQLNNMIKLDEFQYLNKEPSWPKDSVAKLKTFEILSDRLKLEHFDTVIRAMITLTWVPFYNDLPFVYAAEIGYLEFINASLACGADVNMYSINSTSHVTALHMATAAHRPQIVKRLLSHDNINPNMLLYNSETPLHIATQNRDVEIVKLLLAHPKTDCTILNRYKLTPMSRIEESNPRFSELRNLYLEHFCQKLSEAPPLQLPNIVASYKNLNFRPDDIFNFLNKHRELKLVKKSIALDYSGAPMNALSHFMHQSGNNAVDYVKQLISQSININSAIDNIKKLLIELEMQQTPEYGVSSGTRVTMLAPRFAQRVTPDASTALRPLREGATLRL